MVKQHKPVLLMIALKQLVQKLEIQHFQIQHLMVLYVMSKNFDFIRVMDQMLAFQMVD